LEWLSGGHQCGMRYRSRPSTDSMKRPHGRRDTQDLTELPFAEAAGAVFVRGTEPAAGRGDRRRPWIENVVGGDCGMESLTWRDAAIAQAGL
jgi:hypothetical protein